MKRLMLIFLAIMALTSTVISQNVESNQGSKLNDPKKDWWREAKFGMFIHWGLYAVPA